MTIIYFHIIAQHTATLSTLLVMNCKVSLYMVLVAVGCSILMPPIPFFFVTGDEFGEPIIAERMIRIADNPTSKGTVVYRYMYMCMCMYVLCLYKGISRYKHIHILDMPLYTHSGFVFDCPACTYLDNKLIYQF